MATFYVGQRVRIVRTESYPEAVGAETTITALNMPAWTPSRGAYWGHRVALRVQAVRGGIRAHEWINLTPHPDNLEPIVDDGRQVVSWSECLWQPEGVAA